MNSKVMIPEEGLYVSKKDPSMRFVITDLFVDEDEDFFLVTVVREGDEDDMLAPGFEYDSDEWLQFVKKHQLQRTTKGEENLAKIRAILAKAKKQ